MIIVHRSRKNHNNANDLFKLSINYTYVNYYLVITITVDDEFLDDLRDALQVDSHF